MEVIEYRHYLDRAEDRVTMYDVPRPPSYVVHIPMIFAKWCEWAEQRPKPLEQTTDIRPMGEGTGPEWLREDFTGVEDFYEHVQALLGAGPDGR